MAFIGTQDITGTKVEIHAYKHGVWSIATEGDGDKQTLGNGDTLEKALTAARTSLAKRKVRVSVPFLTVEGTPGIAYGLHASNDDVLARVDGKAERFGRYKRRETLKADTPPEQIDRLASAHVAQRSAEAEQREIFNEWELDLGKAVRSAIDAKLAEAEAEGEGGEES